MHSARLAWAGTSHTSCPMPRPQHVLSPLPQALGTQQVSSSPSISSDFCTNHFSSLSLSFLIWKMGLAVSPWGAEVLRRGGNPFLCRKSSQQPLRESGCGGASPRAPQEGGPGPEKKVFGSRSHNDSGLEAATSHLCRAQLPLALKPLSQEGAREAPGSRMRMVRGLLVSWVPSLPHPSAPPPLLPRGVRLLTFTSDPNRHLISPLSCPSRAPPAHGRAVHTFSDMSFH